MRHVSRSHGRGVLHTPYRMAPQGTKSRAFGCLLQISSPCGNVWWGVCNTPLPGYIKTRHVSVLLPSRKCKTRRVSVLLLSRKCKTRRVLVLLLGRKSKTRRVSVLLLGRKCKTHRVSVLLLGRKSKTRRVLVFLVGRKYKTRHVSRSHGRGYPNTPHRMVP